MPFDFISFEFIVLNNCQFMVFNLKIIFYVIRISYLFYETKWPIRNYFYIDLLRRFESLVLN